MHACVRGAGAGGGGGQGGNFCLSGVDMHSLCPVVEMGGGVRGVNPPPHVQRTLAFMLSRETLQKTLDRKTPPPPPKCFTLFRTLHMPP